MTLNASTALRAEGVVGIILHNLGTLRLFRDHEGRLAVEVVGFVTDEGRDFLSELGGQLEEITDEVLCFEHPDSFSPWPTERPERYWRRRP